MRWLFLSTILILVSCKKEDTEAPQVTISAPIQLSSYAFNDALIVEAHAEDDQNLEYVNLDLLDHNLSLLRSKRFHPDGNSFDLNEGFNLDDIHYETGQYYVRVSAHDGFNTQSEYLEISYQGVAKELSDILYVRNDGGQYSLVSLNSGNPICSIGPDYLGMAVNSYDQDVYLSGSQQGDLFAYDLTNNWELWRLPNPAVGGSDGFTSLSFDPLKRRLFYANGLDGLYILSKSGQATSVLSAALGNWKREESNFGDDHVLVDEENASGNLHVLRSYLRSTGILMNQVTMPFDIKAVYQKSSNQYFVWGHDGNGIEMNVLTEPSSLWEPLNFSNDLLYEVIRVDANRFVLLGSGGVYLYNFSNNNYVHISSNIYAKGVYNTVDGQLVLMNSTEIVTMNLLGQIGQSYPVNNAVDIDLLYNK